LEFGAWSFRHLSHPCHPYYYPSEFARLAQISLSSFNLFNSFNFGCGFAALGASVVELPYLS
jgi:hypothetical protein